jgi:hypothetical protein
MSCKCKNIIENFQGGTIPLDTSFLGNVDICGSGSVLSVSNIIGCSPVTIGSDSGCTSGNTTLIVSGSSVFSCDIDILGNIYSGGTNLLDIFSGFNSIWTLDFTDGVLTTTLYAAYNLTIDSVTNVLNSPTTTITVEGLPYTLGNPITLGESIEVTVSTGSVINLNITQ